MNQGLNLFLLCRRGFFFCLAIVFLAAGGAPANPTPPPPGPAATEMLSLSGHGEYFEVILKFPPFTPGNEAVLTAYVLDGVTNEPVQGATVSGGLSSGTESITVPFIETIQPVAGAYQGKVRVERGEASSWLFDISLGEKSDLVAIDGFKAGEKVGPAAPASPTDEESGAGIRLTPTAIAILLAIFAVLQAVIFIFIRRLTSGGSVKESR